MKNLMKRIITSMVVIIFIAFVSVSGIVYAGFADFDDETADAQGENDLKEQQEQDAANFGKSSNNYLSELSVNGYELTPEFDKQTVNYSIEEEVIDKTIEINAVADDSRATITGNGVVELQSGENELRIDVMAENGVARTYFIKVVKKVEEENLKLKELKLTGITNDGNSNTLEISPEFNQDTFKYECKVYNDVTKIDLEALSELDDSIIEIEGNEDLQVGSNVITVTVKSEDNTNETVYKIEVIRAENADVVVNENESNINLNLVIAIVVIIVILVILLIFVKKSKGTKSRH